MVLQEWDRCYLLAKARRLVDDAQDMAMMMTDDDCRVPRLSPVEVKSGMLDDTTVRVLEWVVGGEMKDDLFRELMDFMGKC